MPSIRASRAKLLAKISWYSFHAFHQEWKSKDVERKETFLRKWMLKSRKFTFITIRDNIDLDFYFYCVQPCRKNFAVEEVLTCCKDQANERSKLQNAANTRRRKGRNSKTLQIAGKSTSPRKWEKIPTQNGKKIQKNRSQKKLNPIIMITIVIVMMIIVTIIKSKNENNSSNSKNINNNHNHSSNRIIIVMIITIYHYY